MAIRQKPKAPNTNEDKALSFINKGGTIAGEKTVAAGHQPVNLKIPIEMLSQVDEAVGKRRVPIYRVQWILEAIVEKLERENASS